MKKKKYNKQIKWHDATKFVPDNDRSVLLYIRNTEFITHTTNAIGAYLNDKFYAKGGFASNEKVVRWCEIPDFEDNKTSAEWSKIYDRPDTVKSGKDLISEWGYICKAIEF